MYLQLIYLYIVTGYLKQNKGNKIKIYVYIQKNTCFFITRSPQNYKLKGHVKVVM